MSIVASPPSSPFKGLAAFEDSALDALFFFGRERERGVLVANLLAARLTVLYGESGVGKSSLLGAGVVRDLREQAPGALVEMHDSWSGSVHGILDRAREAEEAYLILDQFEEFFLYHSDDREPAGLLDELPGLLRGTRVNVLLSLREDSLAKLDAFKARIPSVFANQVRLEHLDRRAARSAILGPIARWNELAGESIGIEDELVEAVLDELTREGGLIEAPYLQLVLERIWHAERDAGSGTLRLETLRALGGAGTIFRDHLEVALAALDAEERDVAASMFEHLVTPSGTKIAHRVRDLAEYANVREDVLQRVLDELTRDRIVHSVDGSDGYEIFHDVLAEPIRDWRLQRRIERERVAARRRQRRLYAFSGVTLVAFAIVAGLAVWAFAERGSARSQTRHARARELEASALQQLTTDPNRSVRLALSALRLDTGAPGESVLRQALIEDRLRLVKHTDGPVRALAISHRGALVAVAESGGHVLLLNAHNRRLVRRIAVPRTVAALSFSPDDRKLVTASPVGVAEVWEVATGRRLATPRAAAAREPDGTLRLVPLRGELARAIAHARGPLAVAPGSGIVAVAVAEPGGRVRPWVFDSRGRLLHVLTHRGIRDIAFSPDGRVLASAGADGFTVLWNSQTGELLRMLADAKSGVDVIAFSPDGTLLATGGADSAVRVWNVATGERTFFLVGHTNPVTALAWSPDGRVVASGSPDRTVRLWRMRGVAAAGSLVAALTTAQAVRALAFFPDATQLVTGGDDPKVRIWDARPEEQLDLLASAPGPALAARWVGNTIVGLWPRAIKIYDARSRTMRHVLPSDRKNPFTSIAVARSGAVVAAGDRGGKTRVWDARTGARLATPAGSAAVSAVAVSARGDLVASGDRDGTTRLWSVSGNRLRWSAHEAGAVATIAFSPAGDRLVTAGRSGATLWSVSDGRRLHELASPGGAVDAAFSPDGRLVATAGADGVARLWFVRTGHAYRVLRGHTRPVTDVAFSATGRLLATSSEDADVRIWNVDLGLGQVLQRSAFGPVSAIAFDSTGRWVAGAAPISVVLWTAASGRQLFYLRGHTSTLTGVTFAPSGATVLSSSRDGTLRTYTCQVCVDLAALVHLAEVRLAQTR